MKAILLSILGLSMIATASTAADKEEAKDNRLFELRTYYVFPGKMKDMQARFRDHTTKLFEKHGMTLIGFWNPTDPKEAEVKLIYILAHKDKAAAEKSWAAFRTDPDWIKARDASEKNGKIVEKVEAVYMNPTDYSKIK